MTAFCIIAAAVLFVPSFPAFEQEEDNVYEVRLNGEAVGLTEHPEEAEELLAQARAAAVSDSDGMVFTETELELEGQSMLFGRLDGQDTIRENMQRVLESSVLDTLQRAYTVKINEYTVNLRSSDEVLTLLNTCLDEYDTEDEYTVELNVDPGSELNVLTASIRRTRLRRMMYRRAPAWGRSMRSKSRRLNRLPRRILRIWITDWWSWNLRIPWKWWRLI